MVTTLAGSNAFMVQQELHRLIQGFVTEHTDMGLEKFDGEGLDPKRLPSIVQSLPFLVAKRMVVLRNPSAQKPVTEQLEKLLGDVPDTTELIIVESALDKRTSYYKILQKKTNFQVFDELNEQALSKWVVSLAQSQGGTIGQGDALFLVHRVGTNQSLVANEVKKLVHYNPHITRATITDMTDPLPQSSVFDLLDAAFAGNIPKVLSLYREQRQQKVEPLAIMAMIAWQLHILAVIKTAGDRSPSDIASQAKVSPFVVRKSQPVARRLSLAQLKQLIQDAYALDVGLKSQPIDPDEAIQQFLLQLAT